MNDIPPDQRIVQVPFTWAMALAITKAATFLAAQRGVPVPNFGSHGSSSNYTLAELCFIANALALVKNPTTTEKAAAQLIVAAGHEAFFPRHAYPQLLDATPT